ncbi:MAG TPA: hypothetical protein VK071_05980 [Tissierellales bacterium]|nr:hypothetical protein [Tissierellales bacterium]
MNSGFRKGTLFGSLLGASVGIFIMNRMNPFKRMKAMRSTRKAMSSVKNGFSRLW